MDAQRLIPFSAITKRLTAFRKLDTLSSFFFAASTYGNIVNLRIHVHYASWIVVYSPLETLLHWALQRKFAETDTNCRMRQKKWTTLQRLCALDNKHSVGETY